MKRLLAPALVLCLVGLGVWGWYRSRKEPNSPRSSQLTAQFASSAQGSRSPGASKLQAPASDGSDTSALPAAAPVGSSNTGPFRYSAVPPLAPELANLPEATVLENMRTVIRQYGAMFGGNPVGTNEEITRALEGDNPKHINFLKADGNRVNAAGQLVDIWGTPYFFHQLSGTEMEIRSAGPDRRMWTADDLVTR